MADDGSIDFIFSNGYPSLDNSYGSFDGLIDEAIIWNKALTDEEVLKLYSNANRDFYTYSP